MAFWWTSTGRFIARLWTRSTFHGPPLHLCRHSAVEARSGYNDDWRLSTDWVNSLGTKAEYAEVKRDFQKIYWGTNGTRGNVWRERWLVLAAPAGALGRARRAGALHRAHARELRHTLKHFGVGKLFSRTVTMDDVKQLKPRSGRACCGCLTATNRSGALSGRQYGRRAGVRARGRAVPRRASATAAKPIACARGNCAATGRGSFCTAPANWRSTGNEKRHASIGVTNGDGHPAAPESGRPRAGATSPRGFVFSITCWTWWRATAPWTCRSWPRAIWTWTSTTPWKIWASRWARR